MSDLQQLPVCIIGAGSSGVAAAKALHAQGVAVEGFEIGSDIGGMWRYQNDNGLSSAYRSLHIDTTRMHELIGETRVDWRDGIRRQLQCLAPQVLKSRQ